VFKLLHEGGEYLKGRGPEFAAWRKKNKRDKMFLPFERALGARQDLKFDGCLPLFWNRNIILEFVRGFIDCKKSAGILDKSVYTRLRSNSFTALLRINVLWKYAFSEPFRWLAGKTSTLKGWSLWKMGWALELVEKAMNEIVADPSRIFAADLDIFAPVAAELPEFADWRAEERARKVKAENGTQYVLWQEVLKEARTPAPGSGNAQATELTLRLAKEMAQKALDKMHCPKVALADKLESQVHRNSTVSRVQ
jgi:hypothetical protein